jgi:hypothetical protein
LWVNRFILVGIGTKGEGIYAAQKYRVTLTDDEKKTLGDIVNKGKHGAQKRRRAQALLLANEGYADEMMAGRTDMHRRGIEELR